MFCWRWRRGQRNIGREQLLLPGLPVFLSGSLLLVLLLEGLYDQLRSRQLRILNRAGVDK